MINHTFNKRCDSHILIYVLRDLQRSIAREPSAPSFSVPAYQTTPAPPAAGPTPAPRTVFVSNLSEIQMLDRKCGRLKADLIFLFCQPEQAEQQPQAKPPARPPPPNFPPHAASSTPTSAPPAGPPSNNPPPVAPPTQAQGPPYPSYQGYPGYVYHPYSLTADETDPAKSTDVVPGLCWFN